MPHQVDSVVTKLRLLGIEDAEPIAGVLLDRMHLVDAYLSRLQEITVVCIQSMSDAPTHNML